MVKAHDMSTVCGLWCAMGGFYLSLMWWLKGVVIEEVVMVRDQKVVAGKE